MHHFDAEAGVSPISKKMLTSYTYESDWQRHFIALKRIMEFRSALNTKDIHVLERKSLSPYLN